MRNSVPSFDYNKNDDLNFDDDVYLSLEDRQEDYYDDISDSELLSMLEESMDDSGQEFNSFNNYGYGDQSYNQNSGQFNYQNQPFRSEQSPSQNEDIPIGGPQSKAPMRKKSSSGYYDESARNNLPNGGPYEGNQQFQSDENRASTFESDFSQNSPFDQFEQTRQNTYNSNTDRNAGDSADSFQRYKENLQRQKDNFTQSDTARDYSRNNNEGHNWSPPSQANPRNNLANNPLSADNNQQPNIRRPQNDNISSPNNLYNNVSFSNPIQGQPEAPNYTGPSPNSYPPQEPQNPSESPISSNPDFESEFEFFDLVNNSESKPIFQREQVRKGPNARTNQDYIPPNNEGYSNFNIPQNASNEFGEFDANNYNNQSAPGFTNQPANANNAMNADSQNRFAPQPSSQAYPQAAEAAWVPDEQTLNNSQDAPQFKPKLKLSQPQVINPQSSIHFNPRSVSRSPEVKNTPAEQNAAQAQTNRSPQDYQFGSSAPAPSPGSFEADFFGQDELNRMDDVGLFDNNDSPLDKLFSKPLSTINLESEEEFFDFIDADQQGQNDSGQNQPYNFQAGPQTNTPQNNQFWGSEASETPAQNDSQKASSDKKTAPNNPRRQRSSRKKKEENIETESNTLSMLAYIPIIGLICIFFAARDKKNKPLRFHVNQGVLLTIFVVLLETFILIMNNYILSVTQNPLSSQLQPDQRFLTITIALQAVGAIIMVALTIIGLNNASKGRLKKLPIIGGLTRFWIFKSGIIQNDDKKQVSA